MLVIEVGSVFGEAKRGEQMSRLLGLPQAKTTQELAIYIRHHDAKLLTTRRLALR